MSTLNHRQPIVCPDCGNTQTTALGALPENAWFAGVRLMAGPAAGVLHACRACALRFRWPCAEPADYIAMYEAVPVGNWAVEARLDFELVSDQIRKHAAPGSRLLDVGCHTGGLLSKFASDHQCYGVEPNPSARTIAMTRGLRGTWDSLEPIPAELKFDVITCCDVVEHVVAPSAFIELMLSKLAPGGILIFSTGDADSTFARLCGSRWWYCFYSEHISFVSVTWLRRLATRQALEVLSVERFCHDPIKGLTWLKRAVMSVSYALAPAIVKRALAAAGSHAFVEWPVGDGVARDHMCAVVSRTSTAVKAGR